MAYIEKRKKGYLVRVVLGYDANRKRIVKNEMYYPSAKSEKAQMKEVQKYADELERKIKNNEYYNIQEITLNGFYNQWKENLAPNYLTVSKQEYYADIMEKHFLPTLGYMNIAKITPLQLQAIVKKMDREQGLKPKSIRTYFSVISSIMNQAYKMQIIKDNPVLRITFPKMENDVDEIHTFTADQAKVFLAALEAEYTVPYHQPITVSSMWKAYFTLALFSGARRGELTALTWNDIDFRALTISITKATAITKNGQIIKEPKTKSGIREIMLPLPVFVKLKEWKEEQKNLSKLIGKEWTGKTASAFDGNFIFTQSNGKQIDIHTPTHKFREIIEMYNRSVPTDYALPLIKLHDLRHCTASLLIANGVDIATVSRMMGHSKISITLDCYTHALKKNDETISNKLTELLISDGLKKEAVYMA